MLNAWAWVLWGALAVTFYAYVGYGLIIWLISRLVRDPSRLSADLPSVSVVIAAYNEASIIAARIHNALALDYPTDRLEVLIVTDGCTDGTEDVVLAVEDPRVRLLHRMERSGKVNALNAAIPQAHGEIVVGSDANCFFEADCLRLLVRHFGDPRVAMVAGEKRIHQGAGTVSLGEGLYWRYESWLKRLDSKVSTALGATGEVFALRKACFEPLPTNAIIEDFILSMRLVMAGRRVAYEPAATASEDASASFADEFKRKVRIVAGGWQSVVRLWPLLTPRYGLVAFQYVSHRVLRWMVVPFALPLALIANGVLAWHGQWRWLFALQLVFYGLALVGYFLQRRGIRWMIAYVPFYFTFLNVAALAGAWRYVRGRQPVTWEKAQRLGTP
ncbi:glycosyltransferase family 2 protein [bacterium]|nr:glycosyltransferase family 2 protein [bacterium]